MLMCNLLFIIFSFYVSFIKDKNVKNYNSFCNIIYIILMEKIILQMTFTFTFFNYLNFISKPFMILLLYIVIILCMINAYYNNTLAVSFISFFL